MNWGYVKLHRKVLEWEWYTDVKVSKLFFHLLLTANNKDKEWRGMVIKKGQLIASRNKLSIQTGLTEKEVRTALKKLEKTSEIKTERANSCTLVTVCNFEDYQENEERKGQQSGQERAKGRPRKGQQGASEGPPLKNIKNIKNKEEKRESSGDDGSRTDDESNFSSVVPNCPHDDIVAAYNRILPMLPRVKMLSDARRKKIRLLWRAHDARQSIAWWEKYFQRVAECPFLHGQNRRNFTAGFDWLINPNNMLKVLEGNYLDKTTAPNVATVQGGAGQQPTYRGMRVNSISQGITAENDEMARQMLAEWEQDDDGEQTAITAG